MRFPFSALAPCYHPLPRRNPVPLETGSHPHKLTPQLRAILTLLALSIFINYIDRGNLSVAAPLLQNELALSPTQLGILFSSFFWTYTAFQIPAGFLVDRFDVSWVLALGFALWSAATAATGAIHAFTSLLFVRLVLGVGEAVAYPCYAKILARDFGPAHRGISNGAIAAGQTSGPAVGTLIGGILMARYGWRPFFVGLGLLSLLWLIPWIYCRPRTQPLAANPATRASLPGLPEILCQRSCWGACIGHFCCNYQIYFLLTWMPLYLVRERNFSMFKMARIGSAAFLLCALSSLISGPITDRVIAAGASPSHVRKTMLAIGLSGTGLLLVLCVLATPAMSIVLLLAASTSYGLCNPHVFASAQALAGPGVAGKWMGFQNFIGNFAGIAAPWVTGILVDRTHHFFWAFAVAGLVALIGSVSWVYVVGPIEPVAWPAST